MKLLIYSHFFAPSVGGVETIVLSLARGLAALRDSNAAPQFEITLVTQTPAGTFDDAILPFKVIRTPSIISLWRLVRAADVVHSAGPAIAPLCLSLVARTPVVVEHHGFQAICPNGQLLIEAGSRPCPGHFMARRYLECLRCNSSHGWSISGKLWLLTFVRRLLCQRTTANIAPTLWLSDLLRLRKVAAIPHGLDLGGVQPREAPPPGKPIVAFLGRLVNAKGVHVLFAAARTLRAQNRSFEIFIIGDGPERAALERLAREEHLESSVRFLGRLDSERLRTILSQVYAVAVPSLGGEVFGMALVECMAQGIPIVASGLGAFAEVLGGSGFTFSPGDSSELAVCISRLLDDPALAGAVGRRAHQRALDFPEGQMIDSHAAVYRDLYARRKPRSRPRHRPIN